MLGPRTDVNELARRAFVHLDGVTDEWINNLQVEKLADGRLPPDFDIREYAAAILSPSNRNCCIGKK